MFQKTQHWIMLAAAMLTAVSVAQPTYAEDTEAQQHTPRVEGNVFVMTGTATDPRGNEVAMFNRLRGANSNSSASFLPMG
jgi:hypothetical protein